MEAIRYAMIRNQIVENVCLWNGDTFMWQPPEGYLCIPAPDNIGISWRYIDGEWLEPIIPDPVPDPVPDSEPVSELNNSEEPPA
jgi:hypothetical protein